MNIKMLCPGCMKEVEGKEHLLNCPYCGYDFRNTKILLHQLQPYTILHDKYCIGKVIGEGGFGITYLGMDQILEIPVAIKEFYPVGYVTREITISPEITIFDRKNVKEVEKWRDGFIREARTLARCMDFDGIVRVYDFFQENNTAYIIMEYVDGITLKDYLRINGGKIPVDYVFEMMKPMIEALAHVHSEGLIHRDISPDNIMITKQGKMKLLDFGAARESFGSGEKSLSIMLKPGYAPEEQYRTRGKQGTWSDVYALCATIYKCITGITPLESTERMRDDGLQMPSDIGIAISSAKEAALRRGMAVLAEERIQSMEELYDALYQGKTVAYRYHTETPTIAIEEELTVSIMDNPADSVKETQWMPETENQRGNENHSKPVSMWKRTWIIMGIAVAIAVCVIIVMLAVLRKKKNVTDVQDGANNISANLSENVPETGDGNASDKGNNQVQTVLIARVIVSGANVREEPTTQSQALGRVWKGDEFLFLDEIDDGKYIWFKVKYEGKEAYIRSDLVELFEREIITDQAMQINIEDTEIYEIQNPMTIPFAIGGDGKAHYFVTSVSILMNKKDADYERYGGKDGIMMKESLIRAEISSVIGEYTVDEYKADPEEVRRNVLERLQELFDSQFIFQVNFYDSSFS